MLFLYHAVRMFAYADPESFVRGFFVDEGKEDQNTTISGSSLTRQRNAFKTLNAGLVALWFSGHPDQYC